VKSVRTRLLIGLAVCFAALVGLHVAFLTDGAERALFVVVAMDVLTFVGAVVVVMGAARGRERHLARLAEFLRALSIGRHDGRLEAEHFGDLEEVARAANEIAAASSERVDPTLGVVKSKRRETPLEEPVRPVRPPRLPSFPRSGDAAPLDPERERAARARAFGESDHPEIGTVRVIAKRSSPEAAGRVDDDPGAPDGAPPAPSGSPRAASTGLTDLPISVAPSEPAPAASGEERRSTRPTIDVLPARETSSPTIRASDVKPPVDDARTTPAIDDERASDAMRGDEAASSHARAHDAPTVEPRASETVPGGTYVTLSNDAGSNAASSNAAFSNDTVVERAADDPHANPTVVASSDDVERALLRALFDEFIVAKRAHDEPIADLEFEAFATALSEERKKLIEAHRCRDVRFEIKVQSGEVSLLPRLIR